MELDAALCGHLFVSSVCLQGYPSVRVLEQNLFFFSLVMHRTYVHTGCRMEGWLPPGCTYSQKLSKQDRTQSKPTTSQTSTKTSSNKTKVTNSTIHST